MTPCRNHLRQAIRAAAALMLACTLLCSQALAATITPSADTVTLEEGQQSFTLDINLSEEVPFAGAEFGLDLPEGMTLTKVEFLDPAVQAANHTPEVTVEGRTYFGFYTGENSFSGDLLVARLTFTYTGGSDVAIQLGSSKVVTIRDDGSTQGDTSSALFTVAIIRNGASGSEGGSETGTGTGTGTETGEGSQTSPVTNPFTDLRGHWAEEAVLEAVEKGLFQGTSSTTFSPDKTLTRGMMVTVLHRMAGTPAAGQSSPFADVAADAYYADAVAWAAEKGIVLGVSETRFAPDAPITRQQLAAVLYRYSGSPAASGDLSAFPDQGEVAEYAVSAMKWAVGSGIIQGSGGKLLPTGQATRAQAAVMLLRLIGFTGA